jgi:glycosyltransferase involved in cell wall biosynthesis
VLSVLIPIYNHDVGKLVITLVDQCQRLGIHYQILCFDDASRPLYKKKNRPLESIYGVSYLEFEKNLGRAKMRNKLGFNAMFDHVLFLDCDSQVVTKRFIKNYVDQIGRHDVVYGGTRYSKKPPRSKKKILHWTYGAKRERLSLQRRMASPYLGFRSNNFMIKRSIFLDHPFDERVEGYGHEDTLFAQELQKAGIQIHHMDNAVKHGGLETNEVFLKKVEESLETLVDLQNMDIIIETNLTNFYQRVRDKGLLNLLIWTAEKLEARMEKNLLSERPSMRFLDLWKLLHFHRLKQKKGVT